MRRRIAFFIGSLSALLGACFSGGGYSAPDANVYVDDSFVGGGGDAVAETAPVVCPVPYDAAVDSAPPATCSGPYDAGAPNPAIASPYDATAAAETADTSADAASDADAANDTTLADATSDVSQGDATVDARADAQVDATLGDTTLDSTFGDVASETADAAGSDASLTDDADDADDADEASGLVPKTAVDAIITRACGFSSCHGGQPLPTGGLFMPRPGSGTPPLDWYKDGNILNADGTPRTAIENPSMFIIAPGDPSGSWLVQKITGGNCAFVTSCAAAVADAGTSSSTGSETGPCGDPMPDRNASLSECEQQTIIDWIRQGAIAP